MSTFNREPRARRTHARRSCDLCKIRKTRCELPDLDVPSSIDPLSDEKSCHRCRVLDLPCVVDDTAMRSRKTRLDDLAKARHRQPPASSSTVPHSEITASSGSSRGMSDHGGTGTLNSVPRGNVINHSLNISPGFSVTPDQSAHNNEHSSTSTEVDQTAERKLRQESIRFHGRPLALVANMLHIAYRKTNMRIQHRVFIIDEMDLDKIVDQDMRSRLMPGFFQLRTYHPHLHTLTSLFGIYNSDPDQSIRLLIATVMYIASQSLTGDPDAVKLRSCLAPYIHHLQHNILAHQPQSLHGIQALEILAFHAPFSALPFQLTDPRSISLARGHLGAAACIAESLHFNASISSIRQYGLEEQWSSSDFWLWVALRAAEAQLALEDEKPGKPALLMEARVETAVLLLPENEHVWASAKEMDDISDVIGKLGLCDRLAHLEELHDAISRTQVILDTAATVPSFDAIGAIVEEYDHYSCNVAMIDKRYNEILTLLSPRMDMLSAWKSYRVIRRRWELMKDYVTGLRALIALHFIPGTSVALSGLPVGMSSSKAVDYAINRSYDPVDILLTVSSNSAATVQMRRYSKLRSTLAEQELVGFLDLARIILPTNGIPVDVFPLHELVATAVESAKILMEVQASTLLILRTSNNLGVFCRPHWFSLLAQVSYVMRGLGVLCTDNEGGGESLANGCSNLVGSMARTADVWAALVEQEQAVLTSTFSSLESQISQIPLSATASDTNEATTHALTQVKQEVDSSTLENHSTLGLILRQPQTYFVPTTLINDSEMSGPDIGVDPVHYLPLGLQTNRDTHELDQSLSTMFGYGTFGGTFQPQQPTQPYQFQNLQFGPPQPHLELRTNLLQLQFGQRLHVGTFGQQLQFEQFPQSTQHSQFEQHEQLPATQLDFPQTLHSDGPSHLFHDQKIIPNLHLQLQEQSTMLQLQSHHNEQTLNSVFNNHPPTPCRGPHLHDEVSHPHMHTLPLPDGQPGRPQKSQLQKQSFPQVSPLSDPISHQQQALQQMVPQSLQHHALQHIRLHEYQPPQHVLQPQVADQFLAQSYPQFESHQLHQCFQHSLQLPQQAHQQCEPSLTLSVPPLHSYPYSTVVGSFRTSSNRAPDPDQ